MHPIPFLFKKKSTQYQPQSRHSLHYLSRGTKKALTFML